MNPRVRAATVVVALALGCTLLLPQGELFGLAMVGLDTLIVLGLTLLVGCTRQLSLGQSAFYGFGAYMTGWLALRVVHGVWVALLVAVLASGLMGYLIGWPVLRLRGHYLALASLALAIIAGIVFNQATGWTGGPAGMSGIPPLALLGRPLSQRMAVGFIWLVIAFGFLLIGNAEDSTVGRALRAVGSDETVAASLGIVPQAVKVNVFAFSAAMAGLAGGLYATLTGYLSPDAFPFIFSIQVVIMAALGGEGNVVGALVGAAVVGGLGQILPVVAALPGAPPALPAVLENIVDGLILLAVVGFLPDGIVPGLSRWWVSRRRLSPTLPQAAEKSQADGYSSASKPGAV